MSGVIWIIVVGFVAGIIARFLSPGPNNPSGFVLTVVLGIVGSFLATFIGQMIGCYRADQGAGSSRPRLARSWSCSYGTDWSPTASYPTPATRAPSTRRSTWA